MARKLLETFHASVSDRKGLKGNRIPFSALVEAAQQALDSNSWLPPNVRPTDPFDGLLLELRDDQYWVHERHEVGVSRFSDVQSHRAATVADAVREYVQPFKGSIDGVTILFDR